MTTAETPQLMRVSNDDPVIIALRQEVTRLREELQKVMRLREEVQNGRQAHNDFVLRTEDTLTALREQVENHNHAPGPTADEVAQAKIMNLLTRVHPVRLQAVQIKEELNLDSDQLSRLIRMADQGKIRCYEDRQPGAKRVVRKFQALSSTEK